MNDQSVKIEDSSTGHVVGGVKNNLINNQRDYSPLIKYIIWVLAVCILIWIFRDHPLVKPLFETLLKLLPNL